ncbi:MAG: response regulator [Bdellovibrionales bacterium]|nr:response regulator [Bdellovibrionales bacterium]
MAYNFLLVDDSKVVRKALRKTLSMTDLEVGELHEAENGLQAFEVLRSTWVDVIFLDINMPVMNGMEFMEQLRLDEELKETPVIVVSTEGSKERRERLDELRVRVYLRKPVSPEAIVESVTDVLKG